MFCNNHSIEYFIHKKSVSFPIVLYTISYMAITNIFKYTSTFKKCALKVDEKFPH